jgi:uncharacterized protein YodC (DUF2158 family)
MASYEIGDIVKLKSGSKPKTVEFFGNALGGAPIVHCVWEDEKGATQRGEFHADTLEIVKDDYTITTV